MSRALLIRIAFSLLLTLGLLELVLRFIWVLPFTAKGAYLCRDEVADHAHYAYGVGRMKTDEFSVVLRMNNIGMRDDDIVLPKPAGTRRVLVLGDSFMEGWGVERGAMFTDRLEAELAGLYPGERIEVVAAGVASWSPLCEWAWLKHRGLALEPDAVLMALDATDLAGDSFYAHRLVRDDQGRPDFIRPGDCRFAVPWAVHNVLARWSYIYRYVDRWLTKKFPVTEWDYGFWSDADDVWAGIRSESELPEPKYESYWTIPREVFRVTNDELNRRGIPWLLFMYPTGVETDSSCWATGRGTARFGPGMMPPRRFDYLARATAQDSIPYFSLLPAFQADTEPARLFFPYDGHWSPEGHALAARTVAAELKSRGMIPGITL